MMKSALRAALAATLSLVMVFGALAQQSGPTPAKAGEKTVEEAYLQESLEAMVIKEQAQSETREMKDIALKYAKQAIDGGRRSEEVRKSLEYLALESTNTIIRSGGLGRPTNNFPDIRMKACEYLGEFPSVESKDALIKVVRSDNEPMVLSAAIRSLGRIGMNDGDEVTQDIAFIIRRFDVLYPDNSLAFECLIALGRIAEKNGGIKDPAALQAVIRIATGNYIGPVKDLAKETLSRLRSYQASAAAKAK
jgi:hypothetical protein